MAKVTELLNGPWAWRRGCVHDAWDNVYDYMFDEAAASEKGKLDLYRQIWSARRLRTDSRFHRNHLGRVRRCTGCYTDYAIGITDLPQAKTHQRVFVVTTWKDLGSGESLDDPRWKSHLFVRDGASHSQNERQPDERTVYRKYEPSDTIIGHLSYTNPPHISISSSSDFSA